MLLNYGVGEDSWECFGQQEDQSQSILKEINPEYSLEGPMLKLKLQYFGHLMRRTDSLKKILTWERLKAGGEGETEDEMVGWHIDSMDMSLSKLWEIVKDREACHAAVHGIVKSRTQLSD